jgi:hypothetical protein
VGNQTKEEMMKRLLTTMAAVGLAAATTGTALAQGPVRDGLRRTGEIAAQGTQRVIEGTGQVLQGTGQAARDLAGATVEGTRRGINAVTPGLPAQARADARLSEADQRRDARWRFARHNNEWWYYSPENNWMYHRDGQWNQFSEADFHPSAQQGQQHSMGYRGVDSSMHHDQGAYQGHHAHQAQHVRTDRWGRQYICENGQPVYLDESTAYGQPSHYNANKPELADQPFDQNQPLDAAPQRPAEAGVTDQSADASSTAVDSSIETQSAVPATPTAPNTTSEAQAELQNRGVANPGNADAAGNSPEAPREVNNNPDPAGGTGSNTGAAKVQTPQ